MTYFELLAQGKEKLLQADVPDHEVDAWLILSAVTDMEKQDFYMHSKDLVPQSVIDKYEAMILERCSRRPLQHIIGSTGFMAHEFIVTEAVLSPRQDTEILCEDAIAHLQEKVSEGKPVKVLDMCTGSGCIIISLKCAVPQIAATAADISTAALEVAKENAKRLSAEVEFVETDLFENINDKYDLIVCNPPYIRTEVIESLMPEVRDFEPRGALDGGADGLDFYRRVIEAAPKHLQADGKLIFEIGVEQRADVTALMEKAGFKDVYCKLDYSDNDRVVGGMYV